MWNPFNKVSLQDISQPIDLKPSYNERVYNETIIAQRRSLAARKGIAMIYEDLAAKAVNEIRGGKSNGTNA